MSIHKISRSFPLVQCCGTHFSHTSTAEIINRRSYRAALFAEIFEVEFKLECASNLLVFVLSNVFGTQFHLAKFHTVVRWNESGVKLATEHQVGGEALVIKLQLDIPV